MKLTFYLPNDTVFNVLNPQFIPRINEDITIHGFGYNVKTVEFNYDENKIKIYLANKIL